MIEVLVKGEYKLLKLNDHLKNLRNKKAAQKTRIEFRKREVSIKRKLPILADVL